MVVHGVDICRSLHFKFYLRASHIPYGSTKVTATLCFKNHDFSGDMILMFALLPGMFSSISWHHVIVCLETSETTIESGFVAGFSAPFKRVALGRCEGFLPAMPDDEEEAREIHLRSGRLW